MCVCVYIYIYCTHRAEPVPRCYDSQISSGCPSPFETPPVSQQAPIQPLRQLSAQAVTPSPNGVRPRSA